MTRGYKENDDQILLEWEVQRSTNSSWIYGLYAVCIMVLLHSVFSVCIMDFKDNKKALKFMVKCEGKAAKVININEEQGILLEIWPNKISVLSAWPAVYWDTKLLNKTQFFLKLKPILLIFQI